MQVKSFSPSVKRNDFWKEAKKGDVQALTAEIRGQ